MLSLFWIMDFWSDGFDGSSTRWPLACVSSGGHVRPLSSSAGPNVNRKQWNGPKKTPKQFDRTGRWLILESKQINLLINNNPLRKPKDDTFTLSVLINRFYSQRKQNKL